MKLLDFDLSTQALIVGVASSINLLMNRQKLTQGQVISSVLAIVLMTYNVQCVMEGKCEVWGGVLAFFALLTLFFNVEGFKNKKKRNN